MMQINPFSFTAPKFFKKGVVVTPQYANLIKWLSGNFKRVFHNDGTDYVDCGRPAFLNQIKPSIDNYSIALLCRSVSSNPSYMFGIGSDIVAERELGIRFNNAVGDNKLLVSIGGDFKASPLAIPNLSDGNWKKIIVKITPTDVYAFVDDINVISSAYTGSFISSKNLCIGALDAENPTFANFQGDICCLEFYSGVGDTASASLIGLTLLDSYNFTDPEQWDGGSSGTSLNGNAFTVTDGAPTGAGDFAYSKELFSDNFTMYQYSTGNINPNPTGDATLTGLGFTNSYMTRAALSALHNGTTIFVSEVSATNFRILIYSSQPNATGLAKALKYVGR